MIRKLSLLTGAAAGFLYAAVLFITWKSGISALANFLTFYTWTPIILLIIGGTAWWLKNRSGILTGFKAILQYALLAYLVFEIIYAAANYGLFGVLDKQLNDQLVQHLLDSTREKLQRGGAGKDQIASVEDLANAGRLPLTIKQTIIGLGQNMLIDFLKCLFIATITKQNITPKV
ncbi:DUF4199 family protein [Flavihumibacter profundi]|uniref:DUF4199 family protein n=1 Tax=Flavihumibacter profundi TaxID=2716883 RepID=UPI001CC49425|nr:DUF4199 family protein [Flavihumibacter profundi]MBZ5856229.1 DUF4199 family protein [Flavihumibacter profundi]